MSSAQNTAPQIELFRTNQYYIFMKEEYGLWWDRFTGKFIPKTGWDLSTADDPECLGVIYGIVGKIELQSVLEGRLMLIKEGVSIGDLPGGKTVYKIKSVVFLQLGNTGDSVDLGLESCKKHQNSKKGDGGGGGGIFDIQQKAAFVKTWGTIKSATNTIKNTTQQAAALATSQVKLGKRRDSKDREKFERRILDELQRIFTETDSFYYCLTGDLTTCLQRQTETGRGACWRNVDDRFFWNKHMLKDIISLDTALADPWIVPIIQGFVQIEHCKVEVGYDPSGGDLLEPRFETFTLVLISRRSRFRAGTRYKRRGVDEDGKCANYVETEQIVAHQHHQVSFVQVRGSVPVFWSQPGYKYRPPPRIERTPAETQAAFERHLNEELAIYGPVCVVSLVEQGGKERIVGDTYTSHIIAFNNSDITYVTFDFHEYCRGMHFENVSVLVQSLVDVIREMGYCWRDKEGPICMQRGVFRINCIDCLDRTNVVQTALAKAVMELQFTKLGLIPPEGSIPTNIRNTFQLLWANNGDIISRQYAGTNALKGDYTRTGERKFTGMMKDGMNSANRYYLSRFKDVYRQATIDMMLGNPVSEDAFSQERAADEEDVVATAEHVKLLIEDCKKMLISDVDVILGAWGLIDADPVSGDPSETEMDTILILTRDSYYVADYDDQLDRVTKYQRVLLDDLTLVEFGVPEGSLFSKASRTAHHCIRLNYLVAGVAGYFHMFRSSNLRFFNNLAVGIRTDEEMIESLKAICEAFSVALEVAGLGAVPLVQGRLPRRRSKLVTSGRGVVSYLDIAALPHMTRNVSETQLLALRSVGTKALSNVTKGFTKLGSSLRPKGKDAGGPQDKPREPLFAVGPPPKPASDDEDEPEHRPASGVPRASADLFMPTVGIVMGSCRLTTPVAAPLIDNVSLSRVVHGASVRGLMRSRTDLSLRLGTSLSPEPCRLGPATPEITFASVADDGSDRRASASGDAGGASKNGASPPSTRLTPPNTLQLARKLSHSSGEVDRRQHPIGAVGADSTSGQTSEHALLGEPKRSSSVRDLSLNLSSSQSENALRSVRAGLSNAVVSPAAARDMVLSPFSKLARGVQSLGANLDPRKLKHAPGGVAGRHGVFEEQQRQRERWGECRSRLIAL